MTAGPAAGPLLAQPLWTRTPRLGPPWLCQCRGQRVPGGPQSARRGLQGPRCALQGAVPRLLCGGRNPAGPREHEQGRGVPRRPACHPPGVHPVPCCSSVATAAGGRGASQRSGCSPGGAQLMGRGRRALWGHAPHAPIADACSPSSPPPSPPGAPQLLFPVSRAHSVWLCRVALHQHSALSCRRPMCRSLRVTSLVLTLYSRPELASQEDLLGPVVPAGSSRWRVHCFQAVAARLLRLAWQWRGRS